MNCKLWTLASPRHHSTADWAPHAGGDRESPCPTRRTPALHRLLSRRAGNTKSRPRRLARQFGQWPSI